MADEFESLADRAEYYRRIAAVIRSRASSTQSAETRADLDTLASDYEFSPSTRSVAGDPTSLKGLPAQMTHRAMRTE